MLVPESRDPSSHRIDWLGAALSGVGLVALVWAIIEAPIKGWTSPPVLGAFVLAVVTLVAFVVLGAAGRRAAARRTAVPQRSVHRREHTIMVLFFALFGFLFLSTQYLQFVLGYSPSAAGVRMLPYAGAMIVAAPLSSKLVGSVRRRSAS